MGLLTGCGPKPFKALLIDGNFGHFSLIFNVKA